MNQNIYSVLVFDFVSTSCITVLDEKISCQVLRMRTAYSDVLLRTIEDLDECLENNAGYIAGLTAFVDEAQQYLKREK